MTEEEKTRNINRISGKKILSKNILFISIIKYIFQYPMTARMSYTDMLSYNISQVFIIWNV